jgi:hypothetical protein
MASSNANYLETAVILSESIKVGSSAVAPNRFITRSGAYPASNGAYAAGITQMGGAAREMTSIASVGIYPVEVGAAISAIDTPLMADTAGKARPVTDAATQKTVAWALDTATGSGTEFIRVKLA